MDLITIFIFAFGLCFDSFAVSVSCGMTRCLYTTGKGLRFAAVLAISQAAMPLIGWGLAYNFHNHIEACDHWIAFVLLLILGGKMIKESFSKDDDDDIIEKGSPFSLRRSAILGLATSIDALIAGVAMAMVPITILQASSQLINMLIAVGIIGVVTFAASQTGLYLGRKSKSRVGNKAELIGGIILIAIGIKVLVEHTM